MKFEKTEVFNIKGALRGMRNPLQSHHKSDSFDVDNHKYLVGTNDIELGQKLIRAGSEHRKFLRQIFICVDITAPLFFFKELDTYKVGTVANSTSTMHKLASTPITRDCFETDDYNPNLDYDGVRLGDMIDKHIEFLESMRVKYLETKNIDMILCDLPYGITANKKDIVIPFDKLWNEYERLIKDNGAICLFGQGAFYVELVNSNRKLFRYDLVWDKHLTSGFLNAKRMPLRKHEQIAVFYKKQPTYNPQFTEGKPLHGMGNAWKNKELTNNNYGDFKAQETRKGSTQKYPTSILSFQKPHPSKALHRTEKPVALLEYLIRTYTNEGNLVLDNCMGSGSTGVACINTHRKFIGIEIDEKYYRVAENRINNTINAITSISNTA